MSRYSQFKVFSIVFGLAYLGLFFYSEVTKVAMFRYYPVLGRFSRAALPLETAGPPILWYSWLLGALVIGGALAAFIPRSWADRVPAGWVWITAFAMVVVIVVYERRWFY